jgi:hypothetical protein
VVGVIGVVLFLLLGCLIPFTAGVSVVLMPVGVLGWLYALSAGWSARRVLDKKDPARTWADGAYAIGVGGVGLITVTLGLLLVSILAGVVLSQVAPEWFRPHHR